MAACISFVFMVFNTVGQMHSHKIVEMEDFPPIVVNKVYSKLLKIRLDQERSLATCRLAWRVQQSQLGRDF